MQAVGDAKGATCKTFTAVVEHLKKSKLPVTPSHDPIRVMWVCCIVPNHSIIVAKTTRSQARVVWVFNLPSIEARNFCHDMERAKAMQQACEVDLILPSLACLRFRLVTILAHTVRALS
jgi:hypothetical protein